MAPISRGGAGTDRQGEKLARSCGVRNSLLGLVVVAGEQRTESTSRYYALGHTDASRLLFIVFTIRNELIRVISARPMSRRERRIYDGEEDQA